MAIPPAIDGAVTTAVDALLKWKTKQSASQNPQLLPQDEFIYLTLTLKKIPQKSRTNPYKIPLPHPIISSTFSELCLIIDDRPNSKLTSKIAKEKIKSDDISVTKVIKLSKLKTDYKPFEAKRKLCDSYDMFFADKRVIPLLPKLLGKQFFRKKKIPLGVDLSHKNWKEQIERGCGSGLLFFGTGSCCVIRVAKVSMERDEIVENVKAAVDGCIGFVPKKMLGIRSFHLKLSDSVALPLYQALPDIKLKIEGVRDVQEENVESVEVVMEVEENGKKKKKSKKGRIHEMNHDINEDEEGEIETNENDDSVGSELDADDGGSDKKKRKGDEVEVGKKKKKSKTGKSDANEVVEEVKAVKKSGGKKRKGDVIEESDVNEKVVSDNSVKKKGKKVGDSGKKEKKKGRSVRV